MEVSLRCPVCGREYHVLPEMAGRSFLCPCGEPLQVSSFYEESPPQSANEHTTTRPPIPRVVMAVGAVALAVIGIAIVVWLAQWLGLN